MRKWFAVNHKCFPMAAEVVISLLLALLMGLTLASPGTLQAQGPALTTISDTVYRADGTGASGTVLISWPSFQTAGGDAVAAGNLSVTIGPAARSSRNWFRTWERLQRELTTSWFSSWITEPSGRNIGRFRRPHRRRLPQC